MVKCKCNNFGSKNCINNYCHKCCDGVNCSEHEFKIKQCICKKSYFNKKCIDKKCMECCSNIKCETHFIFCKCNKNKVNKYTLCKTKSCSGKCCDDSHCDYHFDTCHELTNNDFNNFKVLLASTRKLPIEIIRFIIDEYLDNRLKCEECGHKFLDIESDISNGVATVCEHCNKWICDSYYGDCSTLNCAFYVHSVCMTCYNMITDDEMNDSSTDEE